MPSEAERAVDDDRAGLGERGGEHVQTPLEHDGYVAIVAAHAPSDGVGGRWVPPAAGWGNAARTAWSPPALKGKWPSDDGEVPSADRLEREEAEPYVQIARERFGIQGERHASHFAPL